MKLSDIGPAYRKGWIEDIGNVRQFHLKYGPYSGETNNKYMAKRYFINIHQIIIIILYYRSITNMGDLSIRNICKQMILSIMEPILEDIEIIGIFSCIETTYDGGGKAKK